MRLKLAYSIKLFLIVAFSTLFLASVETAPEQPVLFAAVAAACIAGIRFLWKSVLRDEKALNRRKIQTGRKRRAVGELPPDLKRAA